MVEEHRFGLGRIALEQIKAIWVTERFAVLRTTSCAWLNCANATVRTRSERTYEEKLYNMTPMQRHDHAL